MVETTKNLDGMARVPAGKFEMGDGVDKVKFALPVHTVTLSSFYMDKCEVTKERWDTVCAWARKKGYQFDNEGEGKKGGHPVTMVNWYDAVKWCNARSEMEGRVPAYHSALSMKEVFRAGQLDVQNAWVNWREGYRLPTESEWEYAARGGLPKTRFPSADTIDHGEANYFSNATSSYDQGPTEGYHPDFMSNGTPHLSPVGTFSPNGYGLYDMAGNVWEWCWDWFGRYNDVSKTNPWGPESGAYRIIRGGSWDSYASFCRVAFRNYSHRPGYARYNLGFRTVLPGS